ncbi:hypothetical protein [Streptomyces virginiae]|uniref:hypothetical protein n=1 Tax=Streptomyces virginiae TaxID=1961 RepID=UPI00386B423C|nr:hypothetical protein OG253_32385 [Streptomyces virginiae]
MPSPRHETGPPDLTTAEGFAAFYEEHIDAVLGFVTRRGLAFGVLSNEDVPYCSVDFREALLELQRAGRPTRTPGAPATISP